MEFAIETNQLVIIILVCTDVLLLGCCVYMYYKLRQISKGNKDKGLQNELEGEVVIEEEQPQEVRPEELNILQDRPTIKDYMQNSHLFFDKFTKRYPRYRDLLLEECPDATRADEKMTIFIVMDFSNEEIQECLNINANSLRAARWRIRKKMGMQRHESLENRLYSILKKSCEHPVVKS